MITDLEEIPHNNPIYYYTKEIDRCTRQLERHKEWIEYHQQRLTILKDILKTKGVDT